jgi:hypothetical protein
MKTIAIKLTAVMMILTVSVFAAGNFGGTKPGENKNSTRAGVYPVAKDMVEIRVVKPAEDVVNLDVYDEAGKKVYKTSLSNGMNIRISHDIKEFPVGLYTYKISEDGKLIHTSLILKTKETILKCSPENDKATAYISQSGSKKVEVNFIQVPGNETRVEARDEAGNIVLSKLLNDEKAHRFTENISAYPSGEFTFTVYAGDERIAEKSIVKK